MVTSLTQLEFYKIHFCLDLAIFHIKSATCQDCYHHVCFNADLGSDADFTKPFSIQIHFVECMCCPVYRCRRLHQLQLKPI